MEYTQDHLARAEADVAAAMRNIEEISLKMQAALQMPMGDHVQHEARQRAIRTASEAHVTAQNVRRVADLALVAVRTGLARQAQRASQ